MCDYKEIQYAVTAAAAGVILFAFIDARAQCDPEVDVTIISTYDRFGRTVAADGDTMMVGSRGFVFIYRDVGGAWQQVANLFLFGIPLSFGSDIALSGDTAVISELGATNEMGIVTGAAHIFREVGGAWQQIAKLTATDGAKDDLFGYKVALNGDTAVIAAISDDDGGPESGSAYVFREVGGVWQQIAKLTASDAAAGVQFGYPVSLSGNTAVAGAYLDDGVGYASGAAYVFREVGGVWQQIAKLPPRTQRQGMHSASAPRWMAAQPSSGPLQPTRPTTAQRTSSERSTALGSRWPN